MHFHVLPDTTTFYFDDNGGQNFLFQSGSRMRGVHSRHFRNNVRIENRRVSVFESVWRVVLCCVVLMYTGHVCVVKCA